MGLTHTMELLLLLLRDGQFRAPSEIEAALQERGHPVKWHSLHARLRDLRKPLYGNHRIIRRARDSRARIWEYAWCQCSKTPCHHDADAMTYPYTP